MNAVPLPQLQRRIRVALGQEPGDLVLVGGQVVNVFTEEVYPANVIVADGFIAGVGAHDWAARETIDARGKTIVPGLVDAHMHLESTLLMPAQLARLIVPHGTSLLILDPHEVGNVQGVEGIDLLIAASAGLPLDFFFMAPSCVPCMSWEHAGAELGPAEFSELLKRERVRGLAEVMDFPAVLNGTPWVLDKVRAAQERHTAVDGHAPGLGGKELIAYAAAGIRSDHESTTVEEARAKARLGMLVQVREGSTARNLDTLLPVMAADELGDWALCTDDIYPQDLRRDGHIDGLLRRVVAGGVPAARAVRHATLIPARHYGFSDRGAIAPSYRADLVVMDDLSEFRPHVVVKQGKVVAREGQYLAPVAAATPRFENTIHPGMLEEASFHLALKETRAPVIRVVPGQIVTVYEEAAVHRVNGEWAFDPRFDHLLVTSLERHRGTGQIGLGLAAGFGFKKHGAIGSSVAHDSHNLIVAGTNPRDMLVCVRALAEKGGGYVVTRDGNVQAMLPLPFAGLLSAEDVDTVCRQLDQLNAAVWGLGSELESPFGILSFLALSVIPEFRITDQGLFDVRKQSFVTV
jgi:adenine deaminase